MHVLLLVWRRCLTVPAIWTDQDKAAMRHAAFLAGLIMRDGDDEGLRIILEPEAAVVYARHQNAPPLVPGAFG